MSEEEIQEEVQEAPVEEAVVQEEVVEEKVSTIVPTKKSVDYNWQEARRIMREQEQQIRELREQMTARVKEPDELDKLSDDDLINAKQAKVLAERHARKIAEEAIRRREAETVEDRIKAKLPDFDEVVSMENLDKLKYLKPSLARSLASNTDPYDQALAVYDAIKMLEEPIMRKPDLKEKAQALKNANKPISANAASKQSAIGNAHMFENGLTPELKKQLYKEMQDCAKRA